MLKRMSIINKKLSVIGLGRKDSSDESDGTQAEEDNFDRIERHRDNSRFLFFPDSTFKKLWDLLMFFMVIVLSLLMPFILSF